MRNWLTGWTAAGLSVLLSLGAAAESPATGEAARSPIPFILAAVGLVLVVAMVAITILGKKKNETPPPDGPQGAETDVPPMSADPAAEAPPAGEPAPDSPSDTEDQP